VGLFYESVFGGGRDFEGEGGGSCGVLWGSSVALFHIWGTLAYWAEFTETRLL